MRIGKNNKGLSLTELVIAMSIMVIIMAAIMPQFRAIRNSWASSEASANMIQNGRVLEEHICRNLSAARNIVSVSDSNVNSGFITFEDNLGNTKRYMVSGGYVVFGNLGSEEQLAGPVDRFQISCYSLDDVDTPITEVNEIRFVEIETDFPNSNPLGTDRTFIASAYLRTNSASECDLVGYWKLDESSGSTAEDSSVNGNDGTLSSNPVWVTGQIGNALDFDGYNDYVSLPIGSVISSLTNCTITAWVNWDGGNAWQRVWDFGTGESVYMFLTVRNSYTNRPRFAITTSGWSNEEQVTAPSSLSADVWHHIAVTIDADNHTHKMYIDGSYVAQNTSGYLDPNDLGTTNKNYLARSNFSADPYFDGTIDGVRIYNRVLSSAEITQLYNNLKYRGFGEAKASSDTTSLAVPIPTSTSSGDLLIAAVATDGDTSSSIAAPVGQGWTLIDRGANTAVTLGAWYKIAGSSEPASHTFTWTGSEQAYGWMMRFTGQDTDPIEDYTAGDYTSSTPSSPSVTTAADNSIVLRLGAFDDDDITLDNPALLSGHTTITADESASGTTGLVGYWNMDESSGTTAADSSGNGRNGTLVNGATWVAGKVGNAVNLDGNNDYVSLPIGPLISSLTNCTVAAWVKWDTDDGDDWHRIWDFGTGTTYYMYLVIDNGNSDTPQFTITTDGSGDDEDTVAPSVLSFNTWHHIAITINAATHTHRMYINGSYVAQNTHGYLDPHDLGNTNKNYLGRSNYSDDPYFNGKMDDVRIYNYVLTATEISQLYQWTGGSAGTVSGGAGYVTQSEAGGSGTSNFSLNSSNEARTLTIAIAPASTTDDGCSEIRP